MEAKLRELMQAVVGDPPRRVTAEAVRHQVVRRRIREAAGVLAAVVLAVVGVTAAVRIVSAAPGPAAHHRPAAPIVYVAYPGKYNSSEMLVPINTVTNTPGKPIRVGTLAGAAFTPDGKTAYVEGPTGTVIPISTATNTPGKPIPVPMPGYRPFDITMNPDGKTAYLTFSWSIGSSLSGSILPISTATDTPGKPIRLASGTRPYVGEIVFSPDGKTAYAAAGSLAFGGPGTPLATTHLRPAAVIPINTATNTPGTPIRLSHGESDIAITPDGKTLYVEGSDTIIPISTATNTPGTPIRISTGAGPKANMTITPDGKTLYVEGSDTITPISTATNTPGKPIRIKGGFGQMTITPDGKTLYVEGSDTITPISTATNTPGKPIPLAAEDIAITPDGKTLYAAARQGVVPISTATNTLSKPIRLPSYRGIPSLWITP
jgi:DNA-binding beta-propeller fold protein YncE